MVSFVIMKRFIQTFNSTGDNNKRLRNNRYSRKIMITLNVDDVEEIVFDEHLSTTM